jgi:putative membrane protein
MADAETHGRHEGPPSPRDDRVGTLGDGAVAQNWRRLSPWSVLHFAGRSIVQNVRAVIFGGGVGTYGLVRSDLAGYAWVLPIGILAFVLLRAGIDYLTCFYRLRTDVVEVRRGLLFKTLTNLPFARVQSIGIEHPFYFRPLALVTLRIDGAGSAGEEVHLAALGLHEAESLRAHIAAKRHQLGGPAGAGRQAGAVAPSRGAGSDARPMRGSIVFTRSVGDLMVHGLTNNRSYLIIAGILGVLSQGDVPIEGMIDALGIDLDSAVTEASVLVVALVIAVAAVLVGVSVALLSVLATIVIYHGFTIRKVDDSLVIARGLLTRDEVLVRRSRIQTVVASQDWLERLIGRRSVILEQLSHRTETGNDWPSVREKILIPAVRLSETPSLAVEVAELRHLEDLPFTPISPRYFRKHAALASALYVLALVALLSTPIPPAVYVPFVFAVWLLHVAVIRLRWKRGGLAIHDGTVVARSGTFGIDYHVFPAFKLQQVSHVQSALMRRGGVSNLIFRTASNTVRVPYLTTPFARSVVDYCVYAVESSGKSWM